MMDPLVNNALRCCSHSSWLPYFSDHALKSLSVPLPRTFLDFLLEDGVFMDPPDDGGDGWSDEEACSADEAAMQPLPWTARFSDLERIINEAIDEIQGSSSQGAVPKLNWSCPSDALWVNPTASLSCSNAKEVVMMLKSSDRIMHDVELLMQLEALPPELVLRRYQQGMRPEREFRAFVKGNKLVGISQRDISQRFPQLDQRMSVLHEPEIDLIKASIEGFHEAVVRVSHFPLDSFSYDIYITCQHEIKIMDLNPAYLGAPTSSLLFEWSELGFKEGNEAAMVTVEDLSDKSVELRIVTEEGLRVGRMAVQMPIDMNSLEVS